jgi:hypothetical protein
LLVWFLLCVRFLHRVPLSCFFLLRKLPPFLMR